MDGIRGKSNRDIDRPSALRFDKDHQRICAREIQSIIKIHNSIIDKIEQEIQTLNELRNKLISDVVTGQIDVRGIEIPDFEYIEETAEITDEDEPTSEEE